MTKDSNGSNAQPSRWRLPNHQEELLRAALKLSGTGGTVTPEQRAIIHQICAAPENLTFAPEDFVIAFKLALADAATDVGIRPGPDRNDLLARMVSVGIEEFFRLRPTGDAPNPDAGGSARAHEITPESRADL
jgi:hypothetical protein